MAALEKIRSNAKWLLIGFVGLALFAFVFDGFFRSGSTLYNSKRENVAVVDGQTIKIQDFQQRVDERTNMYKSQGNMALTEEQSNQIRQTVLNEWINELLLQEECDRVGFAVGKDELKQLLIGDNIAPMIQQMPMFQNQQTKQFDKNILQNFLQIIESDDYSGSREQQQQILEYKKMWFETEQQIINQQLQSKLAAFLSGAIGYNNLDAEDAFEANKTSVDFEFVAQNYSTIPDADVSVSDAEIEKLYNERKTSYKQEEAKVIDYIAIHVVPSDKDFEAANEKIEAAKKRLDDGDVPEFVAMETSSEVPYLDAYVSYNQLTPDVKTFVDKSSVGTIEGPTLSNNTYSLYKFEDTTVAPDSVKISILGMPSTMDEKIFDHLSDSLINVVKGGVAFEEMAKAFSNGQSDGNSHWETETTLVRQTDYDFKESVFNATIGVPIALKAAQGNFVVMVTEKTTPVKKYKVANIQIKVTPSSDTQIKTYNAISQYVSSHRSLEAFRDSAAAAGYFLQPDVEIKKNQLTVPGVQGARQVVQWAFQRANKGDISKIFECNNREYLVVAALKNTLKEGYKPLASISDLLKRELLNDKKAEKIIAGLKDKNFSSLDQYAESMQSKVDTAKFVTFATPNIQGIGEEPVINANAPFVPENKIAGPYKGKYAVYVINVSNKTVSEQQFNAAIQKQNLMMQGQNMFLRDLQGVIMQFQYPMMGYQYGQLLSQALKDNAKVVDNSVNFPQVIDAQ